MKSYVRAYVKSLAQVREYTRRREPVKNQFGCRMEDDAADCIALVAKHFGMSKTGCAEMLLREAAFDAAEELGLWSPPEPDGCEE